MANLSLPAIAREERNQYRTAVLVNKVFKQEGYENNFMTDKGLFHATGIVLNNEVFNKYSPDLPDKILEAYGNRRRNRVVLELKGKLVGQTGLIKLFINKSDMISQAYNQARPEDTPVTFVEASWNSASAHGLDQWSSADAFKQFDRPVDWGEDFYTQFNNSTWDAGKQTEAGLATVETPPRWRKKKGCPNSRK